MRKYKTAIGMVLALFVFALVSTCQPARAAPLGEGMEFKIAQFKLVCGSPTVIHDALRADHGEVPMIAGNMDNGATWIWYVNEDNTTATFVVHKTAEEACIIFAGESADKEAVVPNVQPDWPTKGEPTSSWNT